MPSKRQVKSVSSALAQTKRPIAADVHRATDGLENFVAGLGTSSDKRSFTGWGIVIPKQRFELEAMHRSSWSAKRIVNMISDDMTGTWREFAFGDSDENPQLEALEKAEKELCIQAKFNAGQRWASLYGGCIGVIGTRDVINPEDMAKPLDVKTVKKGDLKYLHILDRWRCSASGPVVTDLEDPAFGMPESYLIAESSVVVHHTRVIRFAGEELPYFEWLRNGRWDDSILQHGFDAIKDYESITASIATMMFEANVDVIKSGDITELLASNDGEAKLRRRFAAASTMKSYNRMLLLDSDEEYEKKGNQFTNLRDVWQQSGVNLCGAYDVPMTRFFGQSPGGLNSTGDGDLQNYYKRISSDREKKLRPPLEYFDEIFVRSVLGSVPDDYSWTFNSLWETNDTDQATIDYQNAQRDQIYIMQGVVTPGLAASELKQRGTYSSMSDQDVNMAEELSQANQEMDEARNDAEKDQLANPDTASAEEDSSAPPAGKGKKKAGKKKAAGAS